MLGFMSISQSVLHQVQQLTLGSCRSLRTCFCAWRALAWHTWELDVWVCNHRSLTWSLVYCPLFQGYFQHQDELAWGGPIVDDQCFNFEAGFGIALNPVLIVSNYWFNNQESRHPVSRNCLWGFQSMKREHAFFHLHWVHHISLFSMP